MADVPTDFYLDSPRWIASMFEKDWFDHVLTQTSVDESIFAFPPFDSTTLYSGRHEECAEFILGAAARQAMTAQTMLEVGASLGRGFFEIAKRSPALRSATLIEPSNLLLDTFVQIFAGGRHTYPVVRGNRREQVQVLFDSSHVQDAVKGIDLRLVNEPYQALAHLPDNFGLVVCLNVLDQCQDPRALVRFLQTRTAPGGVLALSCSYQWNEKHLGTSATPFWNMNELFDDTWTFLDETNMDFRLRIVERHWLAFTSQLAVFRKGHAAT